MALDYSELRQALRTMNERSKLYLIVKDEMQRRGHWKNKSRGWHSTGIKACSIYGCDDMAINGFYCVLHDIRPYDYGVSGKQKIPLYGTWVNMLSRCYNEKNASYGNYGGRGIEVCQEWRDSFNAFYEFMHPRPEGNYSMDRIDVNGNYEPGNVRWADTVTQRHNQRRSTI